MASRVNKNHKFILTLDDEFDIVAIIKQGLKRYGLEVYGFTDPILALEHFKENTRDYFLVISDLRMPGMNGFEFIKKVKEIKPEVKIFFMTAFEINDLEFRRVLPSTRIDEFIQKPILIKKLNIIVQNHINEIKNPENFPRT
ncbi:MAG: response regulator [Thermoproteota archaeon]|nr:response regulator [Thermoproteota archaeon]